MSGKQRGSYARRTDIHIEPTRIIVRRSVKPIPMDEVKDICEHCNQFIAGRSGQSLPESAERERRKIYIRKQQPPLEAKSLLAGIIRAAILQARREGLIRPYDKYEDEDLADTPAGNPIKNGKI